MEYLVDVTKTTEIKNGLIRALVMHKKTMILLFKAKKGALIEAHHHPHAQMGYVFNGGFDFETPTLKYENKPGDAYIIKNNVPHRVIATEDFYSMDIKYLGLAKQEKEIRYNVLQEVERTNDFILFDVVLEQDENRVYKYFSSSTNGKISLGANALKKYYLAVSEICEVTMPNAPETIVLKPMRIYMYATDLGEITMGVKTKGIEIFLFELL